MGKITLSSIEQQKINFLKCLKRAMTELSITQCVLSLEDYDTSHYWVMKVDSLWVDSNYQYDLYDTLKADLHFLKHLEVDFLEYAKEQYCLNSQKKLLRHLNQFNKTQFIRDILAKDYITRNGLSAMWPKNDHIKFTLAKNVLGLDFSELDEKLMNKMEKAVEKSMLEKAMTNHTINQESKSKHKNKI